MFCIDIRMSIQIMGWIEQHGRPFLLHDVGMSASEIEEMKMELLEFLLKVKVSAATSFHYCCVQIC